jgi:hypothetical protein
MIPAFCVCNGSLRGNNHATPMGAKHPTYTHTMPCKGHATYIA